MGREHKYKRAKPSFCGGLPARIFAAALFAFYVNFLPVHFLAQPHSHDAPGCGESAGAHHAESHHDPTHDGHEDHHVPHPSSEQLVEMLRKSESIDVSPVFLPHAELILISPPDLAPDSGRISWQSNPRAVFLPLASPRGPPLA